MTLGKKMRAMRKGMGCTQQELADLAGVSRIYIQALESGRRSPSMKLMRRLADIFETTVTDLVGEITERPARMQLEDILSRGDIDVWFRRKKLTEQELRRVERVIEAVLDDWKDDDGFGSDSAS